MKLKALAVGVALVTASSIASAVALESEESKLSYSVGVTIANNVNEDLPNLDRVAFVAGLQDALEEKELQLSSEAMQQVLMAAEAKQRAEQQKMMEEQIAMFAQQKEENQLQGAAFLKENASKEGVVQTESGLQYKVLTEGAGEKPSANSIVTVDYEGRLLDDTVFDSSYKRGTPAVFPLDQVIAGWTEGVQLMSVGSKYELYIPSELAYGERGAPGMIGPNAVLVFTVELKEIKAPEVAQVQEPVDAIEVEAVETVETVETAEEVSAEEAKQG